MKKVLLTGILTLFVASLSCYAQLFGSKQTISATGNYPFVIESGNLDNDDYPDILVGTLSSTVEWYKNNANGTFTKQSNISNTLSYVKGIAIADLDGDNKNDVIAISNLNNKLVWYKNNGSGGFGSEQVISSSFDRPVAVKVGKIDSNNSIDIAVVEYDGNQVVWFANNGSGSFSSPTLLASRSVIAKPIDMDLADVDNDGDLDAVIAFFQTKYVLVYRNDLAQTSSPTFTNFDVVAQNIAGLTDVSFSDIDDDNILDVLLVGSSSNTVNWYKGDGAGNYASNSIASTNSNPYAALAVDLKNNNKKDIVLSYSSSSESTDEISYFESSNPGVFMGESVIDNSQDDVIFTVNDFDKDGDLDIASIASNQSSLSWFENSTYAPSLSTNDIGFSTLNIYPNPTSNILNFKNLKNREYQISIYNMLGKKVLNSQLINSSNKQMDVTALSKGVYLINFEQANRSLKFIKL